MPEKTLEEAFCRGFSVPQETMERLRAYVALITLWQEKINLVGDLPYIWPRHVADSYQLIPYLFPGDHVIDVGSGAGFPGLVLSIAGADVTLVESRRKKVHFLEHVVDSLSLSAKIYHARFETLLPSHFPQGSLVITARGIASLTTLLSYFEPYRLLGARGIFPKGKKVYEELRHLKKPHSNITLHQSRTHHEGRIVVVEEKKIR